MRKLTIGALVASVALAVAVGAHAQLPESTFTAKVSPADAGTPSNPKNTKLTFAVTLDKPGTTVEHIELNLPRALKMSGKGLKRCSVDILAAEGPSGCPAGSKAGPTGSATALLGPPGPSQQTLNFDVTPFVLNARNLVIYVASESGEGIFVQSPITGRISNEGRKLRITIPRELRQPVAGVDASLTSLTQSFIGKVGSKYLVSSIGCKRHKHKFTGKLIFGERADRAAVPDPVGLAAKAACKK